jgi:hypothetical protein
MRWSGEREGRTIRYATSLSVASGADAFDLAFEATSRLPIGGLQAELRPIPGMPIVAIEHVPGGAILTFPRTGTTEPRLRIDVAGGWLLESPEGGVAVTSSSEALRLTVTDLTRGGASASLGVLDPEELIEAYAVGAAILRRDPTYEDRRDRLAFLGFRVAFAEGPYVVMVRAGSGRPAST